MAPPTKSSNNDYLHSNLVVNPNRSLEKTSCHFLTTDLGLNFFFCKGREVVEGLAGGFAGGCEGEVVDVHNEARPFIFVGERIAAQVPLNRLLKTQIVFLLSASIDH